MSGTSNATDWIGKAQQDARSARRLLIDPPEVEDAAYHLHQAVEKTVKALLIAHDVRFPRGSGAGHDLALLASLIPPKNPLRHHAQRLSDLTPWATAFRYPSDDPVTAQTPPTKQDLDRRLKDVEAFVEAAGRQVTPPGPLP